MLPVETSTSSDVASLRSPSAHLASPPFSQLLRAVANALYDLEPTAPAVTSYSFFTNGWVLPRSQGPSISALESLDIMVWNGERRQCGYGDSIFACPAGSFAHPSGPECANVSCPTGSVFCICRSCKFSDEFVVG